MGVVLSLVALSFPVGGVSIGEGNGRKDVGGVFMGGMSASLSALVAQDSMDGD